MQLTGPGAIIVDYQDGDWVITDTDRNIEARTNDAGLVFGIVQGFQADEDDDETGTRDSGDEQKPHA